VSKIREQVIWQNIFNLVDISDSFGIEMLSMELNSYEKADNLKSKKESDIFDKPSKQKRNHQK
jgi:hypothetical protein